MGHPQAYLAIDLGAESGRAMLGLFDGERLQIVEVHRFSNGPVRLNDGLHWDVLRLWSEIKAGIAHAAKEAGGELRAMGLDSWGVDFALLDRQGALIGNPFHYRDSRTDGMLEEAWRRVPRQEIFAQTGIQFMQINTLYQLLSMVLRRAPALEIAQTLLTIPDLFNYWLTGRKACEFTNATTTQCYNPRQRDWAWGLLGDLGIPQHIFTEVIPPGTVLGTLAPEVAEEAGSATIPVIAPACHDTGSAVAAVPAAGPGFAWISSGTWSVLGAELPAPVINEASLANNFTNEGGVAGSYRFSKNIMGLWLVQECRRTWAAEGQELSYDALTKLAAEAAPFSCVVDPDDAAFLKPGDMPSRIREYCRRTGQKIPESKGAILRAALEGIALKYRWVLEQLEAMLPRPTDQGPARLEPLHIVGGGTKNRLLSSFAAEATGRPVVTGPVEATATGNIIVQMLATGALRSLAEGRDLVRRSFPLEIIEPQDPARWEEAYGRLGALLKTATARPG
jgi:rhamnulokinase